MTAQPEALRLADELEFAASQIDAEDDVIHVARWFVEDAAAELRRLAEVEAQRDALLEALRNLLSYANVLEMRLLDADGEHRAMQKARAAIAKAEEKT